MSTSPRKLTRRRFLSNSAALAAGAAVTAGLKPTLPAAPAPSADFKSDWPNTPDRVWLGAEYWANPLQDWRVAEGRIECVNAAPDRNVHLLTRSLGDAAGEFSLQVDAGRVGGAALGAGQGSLGFRVGIRGPLPDYRNALIFGRGIDAGITADGGIFIGQTSEAKAGAVKLDVPTATLRLTGAPGAQGYDLTLTVSTKDGRQLGSISRTLPADRCVGGLALVNNFGVAAAGGGGKAKGAKKNAAANPGGVGNFWFADWEVGGRKLAAWPERAFGPLLFSHYTLSGGVMKISAQMPPLGAKDTPNVRLQTRAGADWKTIAEAPIHPEARIAAFRVANWDATKDTAYRLAYTLQFRDGRKEEHFWTGTVRRDPIEKPALSVLDISCNIHAAFPNAPYVASAAKLDPDLIAFVGDQFYESSGGYGIIRTPVDKAMLDYLRKWYLHGWTWRELTRDRPSLSLPDDHDIYQGNIWGEGGAPQGPTQESGGYTMAPEWVNVVYRSQTAHHPDAHDPTPSKQNIIQYYGALTYGRVSFAVLADRQYKSGPEGKTPPTGDRGDHVTDPKWDPKTSDVAGLSLLGAKQEQFLRDWVRDWRGAEMKAVISQTIFTGFPTTHGGQREVLRADYDSNGWPQTPRNRAIREMRRAFAFHIAGDQHLPGVVQYGVEAHRDGPVAFAGPPVNCGYTRWWEPDSAPWTQAKQPGLTGDFTDSFGHPLSVLAVKNGAIQPRTGDLLQNLEEKASGIGLVHFDKARRKIRVDCWPMNADVTKPGTQWTGWPVEVDVLDNYARKITGYLPPLDISGVKQPAIEVIDQTSGELLYALRAAQPKLRPHVFAAGKYRVRISDPESGRSVELKDLEATTAAQREIAISV